MVRRGMGGVNGAERGVVEVGRAARKDVGADRLLAHLRSLILGLVGWVLESIEPSRHPIALTAGSLPAFPRR